MAYRRPMERDLVQALKEYKIGNLDERAYKTFKGFVDLLIDRPGFVNYRTVWYESNGLIATLTEKYGVAHAEVTCLSMSLYNAFNEYVNKENGISNVSDIFGALHFAKNEMDMMYTHGDDFHYYMGLHDEMSNLLGYIKRFFEE